MKNPFPLHTHEPWINLEKWTEDMRSAWNHYDGLAVGVMGIAATVMTLVYVAGNASLLQELAKLFSFLTIVINLWSVSIRELKHYFYKVWLVYASYIPFGLAMLIVLLL